MIDLVPISYGELWEYVELGFGGDPALMEKYQQYNTPFSETVKRNMTNIWNAMKADFNFKFFKVMMTDIPIGFTVMDTDSDILFSFGISRKFRNAMITTAWFGEVRKKLTPHFTCTLWNQNERGIRFLVKNGMGITHKTDEATTLILT